MGFFKAPLSLDALSSAFRHVAGVAVDAEAFDLIDTGGTVAAKHQGKNFRDGIVELGTLHGIFTILAFRATTVSARMGASANFAPNRFDVFCTPRAFAFPKRTTSPTIKTTGGDQIGILQNRLHHILTGLRPILV